MELTTHQGEILSEILDAIQQGRTRIVLKGAAGVGKTFLVNEVINNIRLKNSKLVYLTTPTHKALAVLRGKVSPNIGIRYSTIHSALHLKRIIDEKTGEISFKQRRDSKQGKPFNRCGLLIIDEASMLNTELLEHLKECHFPILFIGDHKQLNPVGEEHSPVFFKNWLTFELTEIIRQGEGNPIIDLSRNLPAIFNKQEKLHQSAGYIYTYNRDKIIEKLAEVNGTDHLKYLAWTNEEVDIMNYSVRNKIYTEPKMIEQGETLIMNSPYGTFYTNQEILVRRLEIIEKKFKLDYKENVLLKVYRINGLIYTIHEDHLNKYRKLTWSLINRCRAKKLHWVHYYDFIEQFADFKYNHALTVHKSQGSTYKDVVLNIKDIMKNRNKQERDRLLYTGMTRASNLLILYNV